MLAEIEKVANEIGGLVKKYEFTPETMEFNFCIVPLPATSTEKAVEKLAREQPQNQRIGDKIYIPLIDVDECEIDGEEFEALHLKDVPAVLVDIKNGKVFSFENILFQHCVDAEESKRPFEETPLGKYLAGPFIEALKKTFGDKLKDVSLLSKDNVFNKESEDYMPYFKNEAHRIKAWNDETWWWWLKTPGASNATYFCYVRGNGYSHGDYASVSDGGVAPAFRIA